MHVFQNVLILQRYVFVNDPLANESKFCKIFIHGQSYTLNSTLFYDFE